MSIIKRVLWFLVVGSILVAIARSLPYENPVALWGFLTEQGEAMKSFIRQVTAQLPLDQMPDVKSESND
jgi:hypothetical protein